MITKYGGKKEGIKLSLEVFLERFKKLNEAPLLYEGPDAGDNPDLVTDNITNDSDEINEHLNAIFTSDEITANIHRLKNNKACGLDYIRNEFLKNVPCSLIHFIYDLFNLILDSGIIPDIWCQGLIMPLYKIREAGMTRTTTEGLRCLVA